MAGVANNYFLMHKNIKVAEIVIDVATGSIVSIGDIYAEAHVPVGVPIKKHQIDRNALNHWWRGRSIPASRAGLQNALQQLKLPDAQLLLEKSFGLSLSDQYWICPVNETISWGQVNFFENSFSEDVGNILLGTAADSAQISLMSPDNTSDGWLKKKWTIRNEKRCLIKGGSGATWQEPYNEVLASIIMQRLGIPHVEYTLLQEGIYPYSLCEDFITADTELISAWNIMQTEKKANHVSLYQHYLTCCDAVGIPDVKKSVEQMIVLDYLILNEDRHLNNFGVVRNANTLEYIGAAPIYDSGTSLWFDKPIALIRAETKVTCKPFKASHEEQLKLVSDFSWLDLTALQGIDDEWRELVRDSVFIDDARCEAICEGLQRRMKLLEVHAMSMHGQMVYDDIHADIAEDIAYSGGL